MGPNFRKPQGQRPYHHGNLREALIKSGLELARSGGVEALGIRELARAVGVTPNAIYRHFTNHDDLVACIALAAQEHLAWAMSNEMMKSKKTSDPRQRAINRLQGVGTGYINFALTEPGWFEVAIMNSESFGKTATADDLTAKPFRLLIDALDALVATEVITPNQRKGSEWVCWSAVHGFAELATRGPLRNADDQSVKRLTSVVVDTVINGIKAS